MRSLARISCGERHRPLSVEREDGGEGGGAASGVRRPLPTRRSDGCGCMACSRALSARRDQSTHHSWRKRMPAEVRSVARSSAKPRAK
eukprot:8924309-Alexandrium_andersonii.AAC.1